jgi:hypothetical protein
VLKRDITYENFDGEKVTETFRFNLTKTELFELRLEFDDGTEGGLDKLIEKIIKTEDLKSLIDIFKRVILLSYGELSEDGKFFRKSDEIRESFTQTAAYDELFMELATNDKAAATFIMGIVPKDFAVDLEKMDVPLPLENVKSDNPES